MEDGAFEPSNKYKTRTNAIPCNCILSVSEVNISAKTWGITELTVSRKSKLLVINEAKAALIAAIGIIDIIK